jgi:radical SAM superfamily enzyme YgiQ (UPF0313 family)
MRVVLISTYELGRQPFGLASPVAWLRAAGAEVACLDLAVQPFAPDLLADAGLICFYLPMHTATRLAMPWIEQVRRLAPQARICCYGLYAPVNAEYLRSLGVHDLIGGEFEAELQQLYLALQQGQPEARSTVSLERLDFLPPARDGLPELARYGQVLLADGNTRISGYTETSRGCKHRCRHCPVVPVYQGRFRIVPVDTVLADIRQQVAAGAEHITFGDPDFFNGPTHAMRVVRALHQEFPQLSYDVTIKIEHLLNHADLLAELRATGCLFITSAVEAVDTETLEIFEKNHSRADFIQAVEFCRMHGLVLNPTFVTFTPWTSREKYVDLLRLIAELDLVNYVSPIQYAIRLLIPDGSRLLELPETHQLISGFDPAALCYRWNHPDPAMDDLYFTVMGIVQAGQGEGAGRATIFARIWAAATDNAPLPDWQNGRPAALVPQMSEPWYC